MYFKSNNFGNRIKTDIFSKVRHGVLKSSYILKTIRRHGVNRAIGYYITQKMLDFLHLILSAKWFDIFPDVPKSNEIFYHYWLLNHYPRKSDLATFYRSLQSFKQKPTISFILVISDAHATNVEKTIDSILTQIYPFWEIILVLDTSLEFDRKSFIGQVQHRHCGQIKTILSSSRSQVSNDLNRAVEIASGEFVSFLEPDGRITTDALYQIVLEINQFPDAVLIYSDEDKTDENGRLGNPFFKPDWCPDSFLSRFYIGQLSLYRKRNICKIGGLRKDCSLKTSSYDLVLRLTEHQESVLHLPLILFHRYLSVSSNDYNQIEQHSLRNVIEEAITCRNEPGHVEANSDGFFSVRYSINNPEKVIVIIPTKDLGSLLERCLSSIFEKTQYPEFEIVIVDNGSTDLKALETIALWEKKEPNRFRALCLDSPFNFSLLNNEAVKQTSSKYLLFLNNDTEVISHRWLTSMVEQAQRSSIGAVGTMLLYPDLTIQHAGVLIGIGGVAGHCFQHYPADYRGYFGQAQAISNYSAVTAACLMCRREVFDEVGGFNESLAAAYNDIDLCLKMIEKGYRNIYLPHVKLLHYESKSRGYDLSLQKIKGFSKEAQYMQERWSKYIAEDPCYNPNLPKRFGEHRKIYV